MNLVSGGKNFHKGGALSDLTQEIISSGEDEQASPELNQIDNIGVSLQNTREGQMFKIKNNTNYNKKK